MNAPTRLSLLLRVRHPDDEEAWREFYALYAPLMYSYARSRGLSHEDAEDVRSNCCRELLRLLPKFEYERSKGGFKAWLRTMVHRRVIDQSRKRRERCAQSGELESLTDSVPGAAEQWEEAWARRHLAYCVERVRERVSQQTYRIFELLAKEGLAVAEICRRERVTANQVYKAKSRMIEMIRDEMRWLDPEFDS